MSDVPSRLSQALADRYQIERELGQGGMATVYLALDLRHGRKVALKVLRPELAAVIGAERFLAEIKTTAALQHPHILPLFDSGHADSFLFYVMPYVEGESLRDRLNREKQLPVPLAVRIASEIASALDYAHRHQVIHRDIKPENILLHEGQALVADFGIALAVTTAGGSRMTETGLSLGTPHYMSPEQAMGERTLDARTDIYALGCVTYEMLLGEPPFTGPTSQAIVAKVMTEKPAALVPRRDTIPEGVEEAVLTALAKLPADRWSSAAEFAAVLEGGSGRGGRAGQGGRSGQGARVARVVQYAPLLLSGLLIVVSALALWGWRRGSGPGVEPLARYEMRLPAIRGQGLLYSGATIAIAPDASALAYIAPNPRGDNQLWIRERGSDAPRAIQGTDNADSPFFSPDGKTVAYFALGKLYQVALSGGAPTLLADSVGESVVAGTWLPDGSIISTSAGYALRRVPPGGGTSQVAAEPPSGWAAIYPVALPGSDVLLATVCTNNCGSMTLYAVNLRTREWKRLLDNSARAWYLSSGDLVIIGPDGSVSGVRFDARKLEVIGAPVPLLTGIRVGAGVDPVMDISRSGMLVYLPVQSADQNDLSVVRVNREGKATPVDPSWHGNVNSLALSPDGTRLAVSLGRSVFVTGNNQLWIKQLDQGPLTRLSFEGTLNYRPAWRPDGRTLSFTSDRLGPSLLYRVRADGSGKAERVFEGDTTQIDESEWSKDGKWLVYRAGTADGVRRIYARSLGPDSVPRSITGNSFDAYMHALSPDSRWIAYVTAESGRQEVYVRPFPNTETARWQVSTDGGSSPAWAHNGRELFYMSGTNKLVSVTYLPGDEFRPASRRDLFPLGRLIAAPFHRSYDVTPDDRGFIMLEGDPSTEVGEVYLNLVLNWSAEVHSKLQSK